MDGKSELLLRSAAHVQGKVLLAGLPADDLLAQLPDAHGWSWQMQDFALLSRRFGGRCAAFGSLLPPSGDFDAAVLFLPKSREQTDYLLQCLAARLPAKPLYLVGEKRAGIERAARQLQAFGSPYKLDSARHCQLWRVTVETPGQSLPPAHWVKRYALAFDGAELGITSLPGVFAHGRLDEGTALLLEHLDGLPRGALLDFGCGAGVLGTALARRYPRQAVTLADSCAFALQSAQLTLAANGFDQAAIHPCALAGAGAGQDRVCLLAVAGIADVPAGLGAIVSNPPFHQGVATRYQVSEDLLREAGRHLKPGGELRLVANAFLRYPPLLEQHLGYCDVLAQRNGFQVLRALKA